MAFPVSVADVWKMFEWANSRKAKNKEAVCEWLDAVYKDLEDISNVWAKICETLETADEEKEIGKGIEITLRHSGLSQEMFASRLRSFYKSASLVLREKQSVEFRENFVGQLSRLLVERQRARHMLEKELPMQNVAADSKATETLIRIRESVKAIQNEVASLQVMIQTFKAQP